MRDYAASQTYDIITAGKNTYKSYPDGRVTDVNGKLICSGGPNCLLSVQGAFSLA